MKEDARTLQNTINFQQILLPDYSVFSIQWMILPLAHASVLHPSSLVNRYFSHIRRSTLGIVRPYHAPSGEIHFRILDTRLSLLSFASPALSTAEGADSVKLSICGGILVRRDKCQCGEISLTSEPKGSGMEITLRLSNFHPMILGSDPPAGWRRLLYRLTQAHIHKAVTIHFLARLCREQEGEGTKVKIVPRKVLEGEDI